jgi:DNA-directed RNA polymerase specialized sigma24 family protein
MNDRNSSRSDATIITASLTQPPMFATLFDRHASVIWRYAQRRGGSADAANEVVGETFLRAFAARAGYDERHSDARPWLYGMGAGLLKGRVILAGG